MNTLRRLITLMLLCMTSMIAIPSLAAATHSAAHTCEQILQERVPTEIIRQVCAGTNTCETQSTQGTCSTDHSGSETESHHCAINTMSHPEIPEAIMRQMTYADSAHAGWSCETGGSVGS